MDRVARSRPLALLLAGAFLALALAGQAGADTLVPAAEKTGAGQAIERAGFSYLTGVRTYAAAVLWGRVDGLFHDYYEGVPLVDHTYLMPTVNMAVMLDPQLVQPYYVAAWILARRGDVAEGVALADLGIENNPRSGLLHVNRAQLLALFAQDERAAVAAANAALGEGIVWASVSEQHDGYAAVHAILKNAGEADRAAYVEARLVEVDAELVRLGIHDDHDHDH